jgi:uncharacterized protein
MDPAMNDEAKALGPIREGERVLALDVLRGFAILGIFFVNMQFFGLPLMRVVADPALADGPIAERLAWAFVKVFCEYKFISLFSILFGIGLVVQMTRAEAKERKFVPVFLRRILVLGAIGFVHAFGMWYGDILLMYAIIALPLLLMRKLRPKTLLVIAVALVVASSVFALGCGALQFAFGAPPGEAAAQVEAADPDAADVAAEPTDAADAEPAEDAVPPRGWAAIEAAQGDPSQDVWLEAETAAYREGPLLDALTFRAITYGYAFLSVAFGLGWRVLAMFLLGAALMRLGFFGAEREPWQKRMVVWGLALGLPLEIAAAAIIWGFDFQLGWHSIVAQALHDWGSLGLCLAYLGGVTLLVRRGVMGPVAWLLSRVGRLALSAYLAETIVATTIMYWWGFARFATIGHLAQIGLVLVVYAAIAVACAVWLRFFTIGPFEWLWRTLTYGRIQPMLRRSG